MTAADVFLVAWLGLFALAGAARGLVAQLLSLTGVVGGILVGAWLAPKVFAVGGQSVPLASLVGAGLGAFALGIVSARLAGGAGAYLRRRAALRALDRVGGAAAGGTLALALAAVLGLVALHEPELGLRRAVQRSTLWPPLVRAVPAEPLLRALERFDPLPVLAGVAPRALPPPDPSVLSRPAARAAASSVVKVEGSSCGLGVQGSGWVIARELVATNVHVVSGQKETTVAAPGARPLAATVVSLDPRNDVALLRVPALAARPLRVSRQAASPRPVVLLGYPRDGPLTATAGTAGAVRTVVTTDAYGNRPGPRSVVPLRGRVQPGESGGPVVDRRGHVAAMIFAGARSGGGGYAVPVELVLRAAARPLARVDPGPCAG
ncbi:MAG: MarP family serine protease [Thermoleophilia bacterium]|nr:MarP family serine protease [Thermoleophilia bacterium]